MRSGILRPRSSLKWMREPADQPGERESDDRPGGWMEPEGRNLSALPRVDQTGPHAGTVTTKSW